MVRYFHVSAEGIQKVEALVKLDLSMHNVCAKHEPVEVAMTYMWEWTCRLHMSCMDEPFRKYAPGQGQSLR